MGLVTAAASGCGDGGDSTGSDKPQFSAANEPPEVFIRRTAKLLATTNAKRDCPQLQQVNRRSYIRFACPSPKKLRESMDSFKVVGVKEYGSGAVIDYKSGTVEDGAAILLFVAPDRNWGIARFGIITEPSTETTDEDSREGYEEAVERYLTAVRERDCASFRDTRFISPEVKEKDVCTKLFASTKDLAEKLEDHPDSKPQYEGGNATYGFFSLETLKPEENETISVVKTGNRTMVLDVAPSPTRRQQAAVRKLAREQKKDGGKPEQSQSRKAD